MLSFLLDISKISKKLKNNKKKILNIYFIYKSFKKINDIFQFISLSRLKNPYVFLQTN